LIIALTYFNRDIEPFIYYSYPENILDDQTTEKLAYLIFDSFFKPFYSKKIGNFKSINFHFEINSEWTYSHKELLMVSVLFEREITSTESEIEILLNDFASMLQTENEYSDEEN